MNNKLVDLTYPRKELMDLKIGKQKKPKLKCLKSKDKNYIKILKEQTYSSCRTRWNSLPYIEL